ncbi:ATP-binding cassette domain-containing protein [Streptomyces sp. O3]
MSTNHLVCQDVIKDHGGAFTLGPLTLDIADGVTCLVGPNGAGKSTFFRLVAHVDKPTAGELSLTGDGNAGLGYLPQDPELPKAATCEEFLYYVAWLQKLPSSASDQAVSSALEHTGLTEQRKRKIRQLSGGMARRLGIAHAIIHDPALLLLDEPTAGLDPRQRIALRETISRLGTGRIVIVSTHLVEDIRGLADRVIVLNDGSVAYDGDITGLEKLSADDAPGDTELERAIASLMGEPA